MCCGHRSCGKRGMAHIGDRRYIAPSSKRGLASAGAERSKVPCGLRRDDVVTDGVQ